MRIALLAIALGWAGCFDFGLDDRRFRCDGDPAICGEGLICDNGLCVADEGQEICGNGLDDDNDGRFDCADIDCGQPSCDDQNPCTIDTCVSNGACDNQPSGEETCGIGCICREGGVAEEEACGDMLDNDGDESPDCLDDDCPMCAGGLQCCSDGACRPAC